MNLLNSFSSKLKKLPLKHNRDVLKVISRFSSDDQETEEVESKPERRFFKKPQIIDGFEVFDVYMNKKKDGAVKRQFIAYEKAESDPLARYNKMSTDQNWTNAWPTSSTFKQNAVPLPVRQGFVKSTCENSGLPPTKYANTELMKINNFLHLTPPHIEKQCQAIKKFCTPWPVELDSDEKIEKHFPIETTTKTYIFDGPSLRDDRARTVTLQIRLSSLNLDNRAKNKLIKLAEHRYEKSTDILTITTDRCPYKKQNEDYANFLLTTLFFESKNFEEWENEMVEEDYAEFIWDKSQSKQNLLNILVDDSSAKAKNYQKKIKDVFDGGESNENLNHYKDSVLQILELKKQKHAQ